LSEVPRCQQIVDEIPFGRPGHYSQGSFRIGSESRRARSQFPQCLESGLRMQNLCQRKLRRPSRSLANQGGLNTRNAEALASRCRAGCPPPPTRSSNKTGRCRLLAGNRHPQSACADIRFRRVNRLRARAFVRGIFAWRIEGRRMGSPISGPALESSAAAVSRTLRLNSLSLAMCS
jgi:hypothetical protein